MLIAACGDDGADDGTVGGVPGDERLTALSDEQLQNVCEAIAARVNVRDEQFKRGVCLTGISVDATIGGLLGDRLTVSECEQQLAECLAMPLEERETCDLGDVTDACEATLAELSDCNDLALELVREFGSRSCDDVVGSGGDPVQPGGGSDAGPTACDRVVDCFQQTSEDCCGEADECDFADDGFCDCPDQRWDAADCAG